MEIQTCDTVEALVIRFPSEVSIFGIDLCGKILECETLDHGKIRDPESRGLGIIFQNGILEHVDWVMSEHRDFFVRMTQFKLNPVL